MTPYTGISSNADFGRRFIRQLPYGSILERSQAPFWGGWIAAAVQWLVEWR